MSDRPPSHRRLTRYLLVKSAAELLFVCALFGAFYLTTLHTPFRARIDTADAQRISGRVLDPSDPAARPELQLFIDGRHAETLPPASVAPPHADGHAFSFALRPLEPGPHEARVYAARESGPAQRRTLRLLDDPVRFSLDAPPAP
jgi:hypothetical protein